MTETSLEMREVAKHKFVNLSLIKRFAENIQSNFLWLFKV